MAYAETTTVPFDRSIAEIITLVKRRGAEQIGQIEGADAYTIMFRLSDRMIKFVLPLPKLDDMPKFNGHSRPISAEERRAKLDQAQRSAARALLLVIKAKLESVGSGIETIEQAFLAQVVLADGRTVHERIAAPIALEYQTGAPRAELGLLPPPGGAE